MTYTIEQLLDFNQGNLFPKITSIKDSYVTEETDASNGIEGFLRDNFDTGIFDVNDAGKITLIGSDKEDSAIPIKVANAAYADVADHTKGELTLKTDNTSTVVFNGSGPITVDQIYRAKCDSLGNAISETYVSGVKSTAADSSAFTISRPNRADEKVIINNVSDATYAKKPKTASGTEFASAGVLLVDEDKNFAVCTAPSSTMFGSSKMCALVYKKDENSNAVSGPVWEPADGFGSGSGSGGITGISVSSTADQRYLVGIGSQNSTDVTSMNTGGPYMFKGNLYQTSDATLKTFTEDLDINLDNLSTIKKGLFYWNDDANRVLDIGITAQSIEPLFPQVVSEVDGIKSVSYSKLGVIALAAVDKLYKRIKELEEEVKSLRTSKK